MSKSTRPGPIRKPSTKVVQLRVPAGEAREVIFTGEFTGWAKDKLRLTRSSGSDWTATIELAPGEYQYRLLVDGEWRDDPKAQEPVPNEFGTLNCVLKVT